MDIVQHDKTFFQPHQWQCGTASASIFDKMNRKARCKCAVRRPSNHGSSTVHVRCMYG